VTPGARGRFIAFEGPEGAGKSTQVARLAARLREAGGEVLATREPGGTPAGDRIRAVLLDPGVEIDAAAEFLLYAAARAQHVVERIAPALARGVTVLCDRFAASSVAYQGHGRGLDPAWVHDVNARATRGLVPDRTVLLDLPAPAGLARVATRGAADRLERADAAFHDRVRRGFLAEASRQPGWLIVDAARDEDAVANEIWSRLAPLLTAEPAEGAPADETGRAR
jgi:dTMP kinase